MLMDEFPSPSFPDPATIDRWTIQPVLMALGFVTLLALLCGIPGLLSFVLIPLSILGFVIAGIVILAAALTLAIKKRPRKSASVLFSLIMPVLLWAQILWVANCIHLGLTVWFGAGQLGPPTSLHGVEAYDWSVGLVGTQSTFLIHDETGKIALPAGQKAHPSNADYDIAQECAGRVQHLLAHYYICTI